jgi:DHA2 family multidrug resistance protein
MNTAQHDIASPLINPWIITFTVMLATFMEVLDTSIANVALPHIAGNLSATVDESTWVLTSYLVSNAIVLPLAGWFSMMFGRKRFYIACVILFTVSSFLCGFAPNIEFLVICRILQGAGGGALQPLSQSILIESFPVNKRGMAMAMYGMGVVVAPIIGPTLGGWITDNYSWRWIFLINIPVGFLSVFMSSFFITDSAHQIERKAKGIRIDYIGLGLIILGLGALQIILDRGQRLDWFGSVQIRILTAICAVSLVTAIIWEWYHEHPVVDLRLFKSVDFSLATFMMYALGFVLYGSTVLLPLFLQTMMGYTAMQSGMAMSPGGILTLLSMPLVGFLMTRTQPRFLVAVGFLIGAIGLWKTAQFNLQISFSDAVWARNILSASLGFLFVPINAVAYSYVPKGKNDNASGLLNLARNLGGSFGISIVTTLLFRNAQIHQTALVSHVTPYNPVYRRFYESAVQMLTAQGQDLWTAAMQAKALIYGLVVREANMMAFLDNSRLLAFIFIAMIPLVFLMKKTPIPKGPLAAH